MAHYRATIVSPAPASAAFGYIADFSNVAQWDPGVSAAERATDGPVRVGTAFAVTVQAAGRALPFDYRVTAFDPPCLVTFVGTCRNMVSEDTVEVAQADGGGCRVTYDADFRLTGPMRLLDPLLGVAFRKIGTRALAGLQTSLDALVATT